LIKYIKSFLWRVAKCLSYIEEARCLKVKSEVYKEKVNTRDELVPRIMNSANLIKQERQDDLRRVTRTNVKMVEKCTEVDGWIFGHLL